MRRRLTLQERIEERLAWRWLRLHLTQELGITFRPRTRGRPPIVGTYLERKIISTVASASSGSKMATFRALSADLNVSACTIRRVWLKHVYERAEFL